MLRSDSFIKVRQQQLEALEERLGRKITNEEQQNELRKPICACCFTWQNSTDHKFTTCEHCSCVSFCCKEHEELCSETHSKGMH
jgi:hypothetical protein